MTFSDFFSLKNRFLSDYVVPACPKYISGKLRSFSKNFSKIFFHTTLFENFLPNGVSAAATKNQPAQWLGTPQNGKCEKRTWNSCAKYENTYFLLVILHVHESLLFQSIQTFKEDLDFLFKRPKRTFPYDTSYTSCQLRSFPGTAQNFDDTAPAYKDIQISYTHPGLFDGTQCLPWIEFKFWFK